MFKTCSDPDFNWMHCLCDSTTWVVKEPGKPIRFFHSQLIDDSLSPSGYGFAIDAFRIDADGTLDDFYRDDYISMYIKSQGLGETVKVGGIEYPRFSVISTDCLCGDDEKGDFETLGEAMRAAKRLVDVEGYDGAAVYDRKQEAWCAGCNVTTLMDMNGAAAVTHPFWTITCEAEKREPPQRVAALERAQAADRARAAAARTARPGGAHYRPGHAQ